MVTRYQVKRWDQLQRMIAARKAAEKLRKAVESVKK